MHSQTLVIYHYKSRRKNITLREISLQHHYIP